MQNMNENIKSLLFIWEWNKNEKHFGKFYVRNKLSLKVGENVFRFNILFYLF